MGWRGLSKCELLSDKLHLNPSAKQNSPLVAKSSVPTEQPFAVIRVLVVYILTLRGRTALLVALHHVVPRLVSAL